MKMKNGRMTFAGRLAALAAAALLMLLPVSAFAQEEHENAVALVNGEEVPLRLAQEDFAYYAGIYDSYGMADEIEALRNDVADYYATYYLLLQESAARGLDSFTEEEEETMRTEAETAFDDMMEEYIGYFSTEYDYPEGSEEQVKADVLDYFERNDYSAETILRESREVEMINRLYDLLTGDVEVDEEDIRAVYDLHVGEQKARYGENIYYFESDVQQRAEIYYVPEGFRSVYHILFTPDEEGQSMLAALRGRLAELDVEAESEDADGDAIAEERAVLQGQIDEVCAPLYERADAIYERLDEGGDFKLLMAGNTDDYGMMQEPFYTDGYYVSEESTVWVPEFTDGAMALEKPGDVSEPVLTDYGIHLIYYNGDVPAGPAVYEDKYDVLKEEALVNARNEVYNKIVSELYDAADIELFLDHLVYTPMNVPEDEAGEGEAAETEEAETEEAGETAETDGAAEAE